MNGHKKANSPYSKFSSNERQKCVAPEDVKLNKLYAFTVNPDDEFQFFNQGVVNRIDNCRKVLESILGFDALATGRMEISKRGRWHFHGWLWFASKDQITDFYSQFHQRFAKCTLEMDTIGNDRTWYDYVHKQEDLWSSFTFSDGLEIYPTVGYNSKCYTDMLRHLTDSPDYSDDVAMNFE